MPRPYLNEAVTVMDQEKLREWEQKCIQEEPPECTATCPLHVDARLFVKEMGRGDTEAAFKVLAKTMPFPGILARICDHPCELRCKRGEVGAPIAIGLLERACATTATSRQKIQLLSRRSQRVAVIGSGFAGLTAAWDLLKKGFQVTVIERNDRLGGSLRELSESLLPREVISEELATLETLKAEIRLNAPLDGKVFEALQDEFDALFIDREAVAGCDLPLSLDDKGEIVIDVATGATDQEWIFAGGGTRARGAFSPVTEALQGRKGALSIERFIQNAQMGAGRENEGPFQTRLFTSISGIDPIPRVRPAEDAGYNDGEAKEEAGRCLQCECMECVKVCLYLERYQGYPKKYARQIFNNEQVIFGAAHTKNQFVNSCSSCGLCETVCPNDFHMGDLCLQARRSMNDQKFMPASFHEFALKDMAHSNGESFALFRHEPGKSESAWAYFPSCQLSATSPGEVLSSYRFLQEKLTGGVGIMLGCCGAPARWAGREDLFRKALESFRQGWKHLGKPRLITACFTCQSLFKEYLPGMGTVSLWKLLEETGLPGGDIVKACSGRTVAIADPCTSRHDRQSRESVRRIVQELGIAVEELPLSGDKPECCGYGGLMFNANPKLARDMIEQRTKISDHDYLAYCGMCRDRLAAAGKRTSHLVEHLFPAGSGGDPAARGWLSWSERRTNRAKVKKGILRELGEQGEAEQQAIVLFMSPEVRRKIDERRILDDDLRQVVSHAEHTGQRLLNRENGQFRAYLQIEHVTFWVDYTPGKDGVTIHNAFCHRMTIAGVKQ